MDGRQISKDTLPEIWKPLMQAPSVTLPYCAICGRTHPLNQHHMVRRSAGNLFHAGVKMKKPTITLCGFGNNLSDADGRPYCHGLAHAQRLHFRWVETRQKTGEWWGSTVRGGHIEYAVFDEPTSYMKALKTGDWRPLPDFDICF